jgi:hypothetical protein
MDGFAIGGFMRRFGALIGTFIAIAGLALAGPAAAADGPVPQSTVPLGGVGFRHILLDEPAGYLFLSTANGLDVRDLAGAEVPTNLTLDAAFGMVLSADGSTLYVAEPTDHAIAVIDIATLTLTSTIPTGSRIAARTLYLHGTDLWFGYRNEAPGAGGQIGVVELSQNLPAVTLALGVPNATSGPVWWSDAPVLAGSAAVPDVLFAADGYTGPRPIEKFAISGRSLALTAETDANQSPGIVINMAVTADGTSLLVSRNGEDVARYRTSDLSVDGSVVAKTTVTAVAVAPDDGRIAVGNDLGYTPAVYTYRADGSFLYQYAFDRNLGAAADGLVFSSTGDTLYAVMQGPGATGSDYSLRIITGTHDVDRPPSPEQLFATPDYRSIDLQWNRVGLYDPAKDDSYTIYRGTSPDLLSRYVQLPTNRTGLQTYTDTGVAAGVRYYYAVTATSSGGESDRGPTASVTRNDRAVLFVTGRYAPKPNPGDGSGISYLTEGGPIHQVTTVSGSYSHPAPSPDGTSVAYAATSGTSAQLWRLPLSGGTPQQLTTGTGRDSWPTWSPDGATIAFTRTTASGSAIWTVPAGGGAAAQIPGTAGDSQPAWSPAGLLAVTHGAGAASTIVVISRDGGYRRAVTGSNGDLPLDRCYYDNANKRLCHYSGSAASWSPDGVSLAFLQDTAGGRGLAIVPAAGGPVNYAQFRAFGDTDAISWSPDGAKIVHSESLNDNVWGIFQTLPDGSQRQSLGTSLSSVDQPSVTAPSTPYVPLSSPAAVTMAGATLGNGGIILRWTPPSGAGYVIVRRSAANGVAPSTPSDGAAVYTGTAASATASGLVIGATYRFTIFSVSSLGDVGAAVVHAAIPTQVPVISPNGSVLATLSGAGPSFTATWGKTLPASQVYDVQLGTRPFNPATKAWGSPVWSDLLTGRTLTHQLIKASAGTTYYLRARIRSGQDATPWSTGAAPVPYDDRSAVASPGWTGEVSAPGRFMSTMRGSSKAGASLQLQTYGSSFGVVADRCAQCGLARIYVDGVLRATADTYASKTVVRQSIWSLRFAGIGLHTVRVVVAATPKRPTIWLDGFVAIR